MDTFSTKEVVTFALASIGAVLGVINTWKALDRDRPKLKVMPKQAFFVGPAAERSPTPFLSIEVTNLSTFPLTVTEVGVLYRGSEARGALLRPGLSDGGSLPKKLEPRTSLTAYAKPGALDGIEREVKCVYAATDCGLRFTGRSPALQALTVKPETQF